MLRRRRAAVQIIREMLVAFNQGLSKSQTVRMANVNSVLMGGYLAFLRTRGYLYSGLRMAVPGQRILTIKGETVLTCLTRVDELENEIDRFRSLSRRDPLAVVENKKVQPQLWVFGGSRRFTQTLSAETFHKLKTIATKRGGTVQQLIRAIIIPHWLDERDFANTSDCEIVKVH